MDDLGVPLFLGNPHSVDDKKKPAPDGNYG